jgi:glycerophosphoryl diester phosphodiesterase
VISSSPAVLRVVGQALPGAALSLVCDALPERPPAGLTLSPFHRLVEALLPLGVALHPWTVNRPGRMRELARLGVASITTDDPRLASEVLDG